jgi:hypothetical protein
MLTAILKLLSTLPTNTTDFAIDLLLAFGAGCGATLGYQLGQRKLAEAKKLSKRDIPAELVYWVLPPVVGGLAGAVHIAFALGILDVLWQCLRWAALKVL